MCWIGKLDLKYAEEDIPIFKIMRLNPDVENIVISVYFSEGYILGELKESDIIPPMFSSWYCNPHCPVNIALHSYNPLKIEVKKDIITYNSIKYSYSALFVKSGISTVDCYPCHCVIVKGYIPKGSRYCENERGEIISDKLIMTEVCAPESIKPLK